MRLFGRLKDSVGLPPGTLVASPEQQRHPARITRISFTPEQVDERECTVADIAAREGNRVEWINIDGLGDTSVLEAVGKAFGVHELTLEDILTLEQRPKMEESERLLFAVLKMIYLGDNGEEDLRAVVVEQVSMLLIGNTVITFQERPGDVFDGVRDRIRRGKGRVRRMGADYLLYSLVDAVVDNYFVVMEHIGTKVEALESEVLDNPTPRTAARIHRLRRDLVLLRRSLWPLREMIGSVLRSDSPLLGETVRPFYRDLHDHTVQVIETLETFRDVVSGMLDLYLSSVSNRMNEIMKVLTIISTTFIPLSFLVGLYGMNFKHMPELQWRYAYPALLAVMALVVAAFLAFFRRRRWI
jgi:magnesium transporter